MKNTKWVTIVIFTLFCLPFSHISAQDILIAIEDYQFPPRYFYNEEGIVQGIEIDLMTEVTTRLNITPVYVKCPWKRCLIMMEYGEVDVMPYLLKRPDREKYMHYVEPPYQKNSSKCFFVTKGYADSIKTYDDLHHIVVGVQKSAAYFAPFDQDSKIKKMEVVEEKSMFPMLIRKRFDTFIGSCLPLSYIAQTMGYTDLVEKARYKYTSPNPAYIAVSKKSAYAKRLSEFNHALQEIVNSGAVENFKNNYLKPNNSHLLPPPRHHVRHSIDQERTENQTTSH